MSSHGHSVPFDGKVDGGLAGRSLVSLSVSDFQGFRSKLSIPSAKSTHTVSFLSTIN